MKKLTTLLSLSLVAGSLALSGCGGGSSNPTVAPPPPPPPPPPAADTIQSKFGTGFAFAFNAARFAMPVSPTPNDIIALDKTIDALDIPNP